MLEAGDLGGGTSSASSKLIHGGLRYLEHYEFGLVREALSERERLWAIAPHVIWPMRFVLPHVDGLRPRWLLRLGLFLYDHIGGRKLLPPTRAAKLGRHAAGGPLRDGFANGFVYSDCWADDARLVVLNARDAANRGAQIHTHTRVTGFAREGDIWRIEAGGESFRARALVNAAGPSVLNVLAAGAVASNRQMRLVRGSHIVVPALFAHPYAYFFQLPDGRIFFAIPYEEDFTLIGTTDADHGGSLGEISASAEEIAYLCDGANRFFKRQITPADVVWSYAGVRPLVDDGSGKPEAATRGYELELSPESQGAPLLNVFGGKLTVFRHMAQEAVDLLTGRLPLADCSGWTGQAPLPGGDFPLDGVADLSAELARKYPFLDERTVSRCVKAYGTVAFAIFGKAQSLADCGQHFGHGLTRREVDHLIANEWARSAQDILWRRTKLGLRFSAQEAAQLAEYCTGRLAP